MEREYSSDPGNNEIAFFTGIEVENTPAYGKNTLFVVGLQSVEEVEKHSHNIDHIFFGANHSFNPESNDEWTAWEQLIQHFLNSGKYCSLDIHVKNIQKTLMKVACVNIIDSYHKSGYLYLIYNYGTIILW